MSKKNIQNKPIGCADLLIIIGAILIGVAAIYWFLLK